jgi:transposase
MSRRKFTPEFKAEAVRLLESGTVSMTQLAQNLGILEASLCVWRQKERAKAAKLGGTQHTQLRELEKLRKENLQLRRERDFLKKANAFFAQHKAQR